VIACAGHDSLLEDVFGLVRAGFGSSALRAQAGVALDLETAKPFPDGVAQAAEVTRRGFDALGLGKPDQLMTQSEMGSSAQIIS